MARLGLIMAGAALLIVLIGAGAAGLIRAQRAEAIATVLSTVSRKALLVEEALNRQFLVSDQTLRILEAAWQANPGQFRLESFRGQLVAMQDTALQIFITDAKGIVRESTRAEIVGQDISARDYFRFEQAAGRDDGTMFVSAPIKGLVSQVWQLNLARRLDWPDGSFAGVVSVTLPTSALGGFYTGFDLGLGGMIALVDRPTARMLAQAGPGGRQDQSSLAGTPLFPAIQAQEDGSWVGPTPFDQIERIHAFAAIPDRQLIAVVGVDGAEAMRPFEQLRGSVRMMAILAALFVVACAALLMQAIRASHRREDALARDRAELRRANAAAEQARGQAQATATRLRAALDGMTDGIMMLDTDLRLLEWNDRFAVFTGAPKSLLREGVAMRDIIRAQAEAGEFGPIDPAAETDRRMALLEHATIAGTIERRRPDGRVVEIRRRLLPGGGFVTLYADVTERRLAAERLRQAQTMAAVGRLTAGLAHDFNNLLASITLNAEMLEIDLDQTPKLAQRAAIILQATTRGATLVQQLIAFARKQELVPLLSDVNAVITAMGEIIRTSAGSAVQRETLLTQALWPVRLDVTQFENVLLNLVINARDAMPGGGTLTIRTANETLRPGHSVDDLPPGDYVVVSVSDTGTGMTDEVRASAFDPFFTTKAAGKGSGLGLSQAYGFTRQSGGSIDIESTLGRGTTIRIILPRAAESEAAG